MRDFQTTTGYIREILIERPADPSLLDRHPFNVSAFRSLHRLRLNPQVTFLVGENGCGKSTLLEAVAGAYGFNPEGGSRNFSFSTRPEGDALARSVRLVREPRHPRDGYFLRAETFFNVASEIERLDEGGGGRRIIDSYGGKSLHEQSHGESFMALLLNRFGGRGLYLLDEPEAALSPMRQLTMLARIHQLVQDDSQFLIATHSPMLLAFPGATIYQVSEEGLRETAYEQTAHYQISRSFLDNPGRMLDELLKDEWGVEDPHDNQKQV